MFYGYKDEKTGKTFIANEKFSPCVYQLSPNGTYTDIYGNKAEKIEFKYGYEYSRYIKENKEEHLCGVIDPVYQFISKKFGSVPSIISTPDAWFVDIECPKEDGFPDIQRADTEINAITFGNRLKDVYITFSLKGYTPKNNNVFYREAVDEQHLLELCVKLIDQKNIQIITGWNIDNFDIPYILNRMRNYYYDKSQIIKDWIDTNVNNYTKRISTIQIIDYMKLYVYFSDMNSDTPFYSLNEASEEELGEQKIEIDMPLWELYQKDFPTYIDYNIKDVYLMMEIDKKRNLLETVLELSNIMKVLPMDAMSAIKLWSSDIYDVLSKDNVVLPREHFNTVGIAGGWVGDLPRGKGRYHNVLIPDVTSSHPFQIMMRNISPETWMKKIDVPQELHDLRKELGYVGCGKIHALAFIKQLLDKFRYDEEFIIRFEKTLKKYNVTMAPNGEYYRLDKVGFLPKRTAEMFAIRKNAKNNSEKLEGIIHDIEGLLK